MSVTDTEVLARINEHVLGMSSILWTPAEVLSYLNNRQRQLLKDTMAVLKRTALVTTPNLTRQPLPSDCIAIARLSWEGADGVNREVPRGDSMDADMNLISWELEQGDRPLNYNDTEVPQLQIQVSPAPANPGVLTALHAFLGSILTNSGVALTVPDELFPALKWGTIADMLSKTGRGQDLERAAYAEERYQEGVAAALIMVDGFS